MPVERPSVAVSGARVLFVGLGGLGCPAAFALSVAGVRHFGAADDDDVELSNLHRQILYEESDVGVAKVAAFGARLRERFDVRVDEHFTRLLPENAHDIVSRYDVVVEGADNFATKFLCADACFLASVPIVSASAVRWSGLAFSVGARGRPCYRCVFEDIPDEPAATCDANGVMAPVVGIVAALQADLVLATLEDPASAAGRLVTFDGKTDALRTLRPRARASCALCGERATITALERSRYEVAVRARQIHERRA